MNGILIINHYQFQKRQIILILFLRQLGDNRVVVNLALHLAILIGKLLILVFHFLFIQGSKLFHVLSRLLLLPEVEIKVCNAACQQEDEALAELHNRCDRNMPKSHRGCGCDCGTHCARHRGRTTRRRGDGL